MKVQTHASVRIETCNSNASLHDAVERIEMTKTLDKHNYLHNPEYASRVEAETGSQPTPRIFSSSTFIRTELNCTPEELSNGTLTEPLKNPGCEDESRDGDDVPQISKDCKYTAISEDEDLSYELQQAYRIFHGFLLEKHKAITAPFMQPMNTEDHVDSDRVQPPMWFRRIEEKFINKEYETITEFVADFRRMLENCYRIHGVDHWISKQAQKLEIMLEQKLTLLSRTLREKTSLAVTSKGRFGIEEEKGIGSTSTRRRSMPRNLSNLTMGASESIMVQALRLEEQQRAKEEKRQREQEKKEAEEASAKELEEWEQSLLAQASPWSIDTLWELPAIGHFLCLAQTALNLPEIVFFELERCLLMPSCSTFLAKVMTSLLCHPQRRATLHRRPTLPYRRWEAALRQKVLGWYRAVGRAEDPGTCAEQLGLCPQFFRILGEVSPLEERPFHLLPFNKRVWLLKGLCDFVYENQKEVQDAVLGQPIHECRESILGYDGHDNAYIHFPHFCGADLRIYCQSPCSSPNFPFPPICVQRLEWEETDGGDGESKGHRVSTATGQQEVKEETDYCRGVAEVKEDDCDTTGGTLHRWRLTEVLVQGGGKAAFKTELDQKGRIHTHHPCREGDNNPSTKNSKGDSVEAQNNPEVKQEGFLGCVKKESCEPSLQDREGQKSSKRTFPAKSDETCGVAVSLRSREADEMSAKSQDPCPACGTHMSPKQVRQHCCQKEPAPKTAFTENSPLEHSPATKISRLRTKKKKRKKKKVKEEGTQEEQSKPGGKRHNLVKAFKNNLMKVATTEKKKGKRKKRKLGKKFESKKVAAKKRKADPKLPIEPTFRLVCTSLEELRELIGKTEDELDELESTKKKSGRWYFRREAVKDLHITLIRLLNELSPWEPKLVKAFQRNRARLKKDYDDFKNHPDYNNFVREEWTGEEGDAVLGKDSHSSSTDNTRVTEGEDKQDQTAKRDPTAEDTKQQGMETMGRTRAARREGVVSDEHKLPLRNSKRRHSASTDEELTPMKKNKNSGEEQTDDTAKEVNAAAQNLATETSKVTTPTAVFYKGSTPIQALLAKSVGNKVTLISQPAAATIMASQVQNKPAVSLQTTKQSAIPGQALQPAPTPKSPAHTMPGGLDLLRKSSTSPVKIAVQPVLDQKTGEKILQQVVILPSNLLIQQQKIPVPVSKVTVPLSSSSCFTRADDTNKIPIQQVAPLTGACSRSPSTTTISPSLPTSVTSTYMGASISKTLSTQNVVKTRSPVTSGTSTNSSSPPDSKQELKTVCIRDSQSILVTTRGGNTGVVKVQTSDQNVPGSSPPSPVITISPQFQAFLVSKSCSPTASAPPALPSTATAVTAQTFSKSASFVSPSQAPSTISIPVSASQAGGTIVSFALSQPYNAYIPSPLIANKCNKTAQHSVVTNPTLAATPQTNVSVTSSCGKSGMIITPASLVQYASKPPVKRAQADERLADRPPFQKVILVSPPSSIATSLGASQAVPCTASPAVSAPRLMLISQAPASGDRSAVSIPKPTLSTDTKSASLTPASQVMDMKVGLNLSQIISNSATSTMQKVQTIGLLPDLTAQLPTEALNSGKQVRLPTAELAAKSSCINVPRPGLAANASGGLILVQATSTPAGINVSPAGNVGPANVSERPDGKMLSISSFKTGNLASTSLLAASSQQSVSLSSTSLVSAVSDTKIRQAVGSAPKAIVTTSVGGLINKDLALMHMPPARSPAAGAVLGKPRFPAPLTKSFPFKMSPLKTPPSTQAQPCNTPTKMISTPVSAHQPGLPDVSPPNEPATTVQQRIVINTTTPLAPGTHIIINNTRFIVPAQGLGPGSHVLLISSPVVSLASSLGANPPSTAQKGIMSTSAQIPAVLATSSPRKTTPSTLPLHSTCGPPPTSLTESPSSAANTPHKTTTVGRSPVKSPLLISSPTSVAQASQLVRPTSPAQQGLSSPMRTGALSADGKGMPIASLQTVGDHMQNSIVMAVQTTGGSQTNTVPANLHTGLANTLPKMQLISSVQPLGSVISRTQAFSTATTPPIGSTVSRMQSVPVATVPPTGSVFSWRQASPIATIQPSMTGVIMAPGQLAKPMQSEPINMPQASSNPSPAASKQVASSVVLASSSSSKILVSPDGAVLNVIRSSALSGLPSVSKALATVVVTTSSNTGRVLPTLKTDSLLSTQAEKGEPSN
ncbi:uncharacterized protein KIAA2026 [Anguilla anguilla]|uniref:uncharacterized protein KIAA2026 n=1 Tax=Anguilla anguilla TaxID=7936 RepID=UPI0015B369F2|nr:uncharacterized protein KIAA2026 [Anguilla anguilla]